ncbi:diguanylate cyclase (GGDEF)-like protein/PAS domain S-box-containing protein [Oxalobacteraceae bacterium GrIS 1.11]
MERLYTSIVFRSTAIVFAIALSVGILFSAVTNSLSMRWEREMIRTRMAELLNTVENTASVACFLSDKGLAAEVSRGLMKNHFISSVTIRSKAMVLAQTGPHADAPQLSEDRIARDVASLFNPKEIVCQITLEPNEAEIQKQAAARSHFIAYLLLAQAIIVALAVVYIVTSLITRPIKKISDRLHNLPVEAGERLQSPRGQHKNEIGRLVDDVNRLITNLVRILGDERTLRMQREVEEKKFRAIFDNAETGIFVVDSSGKLYSCNRSFMRTLNIAEGTSIEKMNSFMPKFLGAYEPRMRALIALSLAENGSVTEDFQLYGAARNQPSKWLSVVLNPVEKGLLQGLVNDISERKHAEETAQQLAATDPLTGVANRLGFENRLARMLEKDREGKVSSFALMMIDLDWFKAVNDTYGHEAGDIVLCHSAQLLTRAIRKDDFVARLGGDEFVILLEMDRESEIPARIAQKILQEIALPISIGQGIEVKIGASIGIAIAEGLVNKAEIIRRADEAMYQCKRRGRHTYSIVKVPVL